MANPLTPKGRSTLVKIAPISRTDTTAVELFSLPKDAVIAGWYIIGQVASDATTSATISVGYGASTNEYIASYDVKTAATGEGYVPAGAAAVGSAMATKLTSDVLVKGVYARSGAETTGGPWYVKCEYYVPGPGESY